MVDPSQYLADGESLVALGESAKGVLMLLAICSLRIYAAMMLLPPTSDMVIQGVVRNGIVLTLGIFVALGQPLHTLETLSTFDLCLLMVKEAMVGALLGFAMGTIFWTVEGIGVLIDVQAGYNTVQQTNPLSGEQSTPVGNTMLQLAIACFYLLGGMMVMSQLIFDSFRWWPLLSPMPDWQQLLRTFMPAELNSYYSAVVTIASPFLAMLILVEVGVGYLGKAADKLEPNNHAQPIKSGVTIFMLVTLVAIFFQQARPQIGLAHVKPKIEALLAPQTPNR